jgi:glycosyltransferase involved in cell wall biosynthesis
MAKKTDNNRTSDGTRRLDDTGHRLAGLQHERDRLAARVAALEASSSWRLTAPLRLVITAGHRARQFARQTASWWAGWCAALRSPGRSVDDADLAKEDGDRDIDDAVPRRLLPRRILVVAEVSIPQCLRYRVHQKAATLEAMGYPVTVLSWRDAARCRSALLGHGCVIFYRTPAVREVTDVALEARKRGMMTFFEIDDLVFDVDEYARNSNLQSLPPADRSNLLRGAELYRDMLRHVDSAVASTPLIADRLTRLGARSVHVVANALDLIHLAAAARSYPKSAADGVTIVYGSGTDTHDADFAVAAEPLAQVMQENPHVRLLLAGPLRLPECLAPLAGRIIRIPMMPVEDYQACLARCDISLAPLEPGLFNDAKSNIKFLEASVLGLPSVCSPAAEFVSVIRDGENGFLANTPGEWHEKLSLLVEDGALRRRVGETAKADVLRDFHPSNLTHRQLEPLVRSAFGQPEAPDPTALKVLVVNVHFAPESFGGATIVAEQLTQELARQPGTEVSIFTGTHAAAVPPDGLHRYVWRGLPVYAVRLPLPGEFPHDHENHRAARLFSEVLDILQPDVIHFHCVQMLSADLVKVAQQRGVPHVITLHDAWWICERQFMVTGEGRYCGQHGVDPLKCVGCTPDAGFTQRRFRQLWQVLQGATHLLTPSSFFRELYLQSGVDSARININRNGVRPARTTGTSRSKSTEDGEVTLAFLGGRGLHKGYFWLQEVMAEIEESNYRLKVCDLDLIHGHRSIERKDWKIAGELEITAPYHQDAIDNYFAGIDVLLFPSLWKESFGLTVREALLRDIWVISTDCGGPVEDLVDGVNATIVPMGDTMAFREAVRAVLLDPQRFKNHVNPHKARIRSFAEQARETRAFLAEAAAATSS